MRTVLSSILLALFLGTSQGVADTWFTLADGRNLKQENTETAELVLKAMREAVFYAQESVGGSVVCASPQPISGPRLAELLESEIANPTDARGRAYADPDQVAFILMHALKAEGACK